MNYATNDGASTVTITNSTLSGNSVNNLGGGVAAIASYSGAGVVTITNSTLSGNSAFFGGGVYNYAAPPGAITVTLTRSLISGNSAYSGAEIRRFVGPVTADNYNLFGHSGLTDAQAFYNFTPGASDLTATSDGTTATALADILDATLADNGGDTFTHALIIGSPAIDASPDDADCPTTDQRGVTRPQGAACDIGAVEADEVPATTLCSTLGDDRPPSLLDQDIFRFTGAKLDRHAAL